MTSKTIPEHIKLNVGGIKYETTLNTITSDTDSMLTNMFSGRHYMKPDQDGYYLIDRDGKVFDYIIKYLRDKKLNIDDIDILTIKNIKDEAEYFNITGLIDLCNKKISVNNLEISLRVLLDFDMKEFEVKFNKYFSVDMVAKYKTMGSTFSFTSSISTGIQIKILNSYVISYFPEAKTFFEDNNSIVKHYYAVVIIFGRNSTGKILINIPYKHVDFNTDSWTLYLC
jgi:hypothetical protein